MQLLIDFLNFLQPYGSHSYFFIFGLLIACGFGLPMPEDIILIAGGILASHGVTHFGAVTITCLVGVLIGDGMVFMIGRHLGPRLKNNVLFRKLLSEKRDLQVQGVIHRFGDKVVFVARFMPGLRTPIFVTCGAYHVKLWKFLLLDGLAAIISVPLWVYVGYLFGQNLEELEKRIHQFQFGIYLILGLVILISIAGHVIKKRAYNKVAAE